MQDKTVQVDVKVTELAICDNCIDLGIRGPLDAQDILSIADMVDEWGLEFIKAIRVNWDHPGEPTENQYEADKTCELCHSGERGHLHIATAAVITDIPDDIRTF